MSQAGTGFDGLRVEWSGDDLLVLDGPAGVVHRIAPLDLRAIAGGHAGAYERELGARALAVVLRALGSDDARWDRRRVLTAGALAAAGITTVLLPSAAMANSVGGVAFGDGFASSLELTATSLTGLTSTSVGFNVNSAAFGVWEVPVGVTSVQVVATSTAGTVAARTGPRSPSPYTGTPGRGAQAVATLTVTAGDLLVVEFSGAQDWSSEGGGAGGGAVGVGDGTNGVWLVVAGGGGGAGNAGGRSYSTTYATGDYVGGSGGDAGTGGAAADGTDGTLDGDVKSGGGGGGGIASAGTGGTASSGSLVGDPGGDPAGPTTTAAGTRLGLGGQQYESSYNGGGNGGSGLYGGGAGGTASNDLAGGGGGGGSSFIRTARIAAGTPSEIELLNRAQTLGPRVVLYY